ncbi:hypothetical protein AVEN_124694-1 [Araneus ventricosus]|uniref:Uncharacterized protein n=1 Tax=Araneus ventricosus TaxID=182803 RepID=A0A4Y2WDT6_ARAVE|nr:hypothetical protein AVEN_124694-1 [Araneus ventricosus]
MGSSSCHRFASRKIKRSALAPSMPLPWPVEKYHGSKCNRRKPALTLKTAGLSQDDKAKPDKKPEPNTKINITEWKASTIFCLPAR